MKFGNLELQDWEAFGPVFIKQSFSDKNFAKITLTKEYPSYTWKVLFWNDLQYLQKVYDDTIGNKKFGRNEEQLAMDYVDQFMIRMNKLLVFI